MQDLTNKKFNSWKVLRYLGDRMWECQCDCGTIKAVQDYALTHNKSKSCGKCNKAKLNAGDNFGSWTVVTGEIENNKVLCECVCGVQKLVSIYTLKNGKSTSCGCQKNKDRVEDLIGKQFGELKPIKYLGNQNWLCKCSCGKEVIKNKNHLLDGRATSCGHTSKVIRNDLTNKRFGKLVVKKYLGKKNYLCKCDCGNYKEVLAANLVNGSTISCGCVGNGLSVNDIYNKVLNEYNKLGRKVNPTELISIFGNLYSTRYYLKKASNELVGLVNQNFNSIYENEIYDIINELGIENIEVNRYKLDGYQIDLYIPDKRIGIEFNGDYWHSEQYKEPKYHQIKSALAKRNGIRLIHIYEYEWLNDKKKKCIVNLLSDIVSESSTVIYARNTEIVKVSYNDIKEFIDNNHIQGSIPFKVGYALKYNGNIIGTMTFGAPRFDTEHEWELLRLCWKDGIRCVGGAERLFKEFIRKNNPNSIISYCNIDKFTGAVYNRLGFKFKRLTKPGYIWWRDGEVIPRTAITKEKLVSSGYGTEDETESSIMHKLGYYRIYDSGNIVYSWENNK